MPANKRRSCRTLQFLARFAPLEILSQWAVPVRTAGFLTGFEEELSVCGPCLAYGGNSYGLFSADGTFVLADSAADTLLNIDIRLLEADLNFNLGARGRDILLEDVPVGGELD